MWIKALLVIGFLAVRFFLAANKNKRKTPKYVSTTKSKKSKGIEDILGDFVQEIENKTTQAKTVTVSNDMHKAEADSHKKIEWQDVDRTHIKSKKRLLKHSDYADISHHNINVGNAEAYEIKNTEIEFEYEEIDLKTAIIYKELLERKYFSI